MKKLISILVLSLSLLLCLTACGSKMPYDLSGTASVELHAYDNNSTEPFAKIVVDGEDVATIVEMFNSLKLKEMKYTEPAGLITCGLLVFAMWSSQINLGISPCVVNCKAA